jgi:hypothetical protein
VPKIARQIEECPVFRLARGEFDYVIGEESAACIFQDPSPMVDVNELGNL